MSWYANGMGIPMIPQSGDGPTPPGPSTGLQFVYEFDGLNQYVGGLTVQGLISRTADVDWGDGTSLTGTTGFITSNYSTAGDYTITIDNITNSDQPIESQVLENLLNYGVDAKARIKEILSFGTSITWVNTSNMLVDNSRLTHVDLSTLNIRAFDPATDPNQNPIYRLNANFSGSFNNMPLLTTLDFSDFDCSNLIQFGSFADNCPNLNEGVIFGPNNDFSSIGKNEIVSSIFLYDLNNLNQKQLSTEQYDLLLNRLDATYVPSGVTFYTLLNVGSVQYSSNGSTARANLVATGKMLITDGGQI